MGTIHLIFSFLCLSIFQELPPYYVASDPLIKTVVLNHEKSSIQILGTTNVNEFGCTFQSELSTDTFIVKLNPLEHMFSTSGVSFQLPIISFTCESLQMTKDFQSLLKIEQYSNIKIRLVGFYKQHYKPNYVRIWVQLAGVEKAYDLKTSIDRMKNVIICEGNAEICMTDFGIEAPEKFFGLVKVNEKIHVQFSLNFSVVLEGK